MKRAVYLILLLSVSCREHATSPVAAMKTDREILTARWHHEWIKGYSTDMITFGTNSFRYNQNSIAVTKCPDCPVFVTLECIAYGGFELADDNLIHFTVSDSSETCGLFSLRSGTIKYRILNEDSIHLFFDLTDHPETYIPFRKSRL
jgi:hypothetical protein